LRKNNVALFQRGEVVPNGGAARSGRRKGSRDRISTALLEALAAEFEQFGAEAVKICRIEKPIEFLKLCAGVIPKEFEITHSSQLMELDDVELERFIERLRAEVGRSAIVDITIGADPAPHREPVRLLQSLPSTA
jgi:hypothetical protein